LEAALYAASLRIPFRVYERKRVGEHLQQWGHVRLFTPFGMNSTPLGRAALRAEGPRRDLPGDDALLTGREHLSAYLEPLASLPLLQGRIETETTVVRIGRRGFLKHEGAGDPRRAGQPFRLLLQNAGGQERVEEADVVLDCTGTYGNPCRLGDGGIPAPGETAARPHIAWGLEDVLGAARGQYADRTTLVVGGGHSAATSVCQLATLARQHPSTWIVWLSRRAGTQPLKRAVNDPLRERDQLCSRANMLATRGEGHVEFYPQSVVHGIEKLPKDGGFTVSAATAGEPRTWQVDRIIANVGGEPDNQLYRELQVHECYASFAPLAVGAPLPRAGDSALSGGRQGAAAARTTEPGFFILGSKSFGRGAHFLMRLGFEQVRDVFALLAGKAALDLDA
jgi:hypothetical protein